MGDHELILDASELGRLVLECVGCGGRSVLPITEDVEAAKDHEASCPGCGTRWPEAATLYRTARTLAAAVRTAAEGKPGIRVRYQIAMPPTQQRSATG